MASRCIVSEPVPQELCHATLISNFDDLSFANDLRSLLLLLQVIKGYQKFSATPKYMVYN